MSEKIDVCRSCGHTVESTVRAPICPVEGCGGVLIRGVLTPRERIKQMDNDLPYMAPTRERRRYFDD